MFHRSGYHGAALIQDIPPRPDSHAVRVEVFSANFCDNRNIGDPAVLRELAAAAGLDVARMDAALAAGAGEGALQDAAAAARRRNITAVPAFVFGESRVIVGAHPPAVLVHAAGRAGGRASRGSCRWPRR